MANDKCPYCRHTPFFNDLRKVYHDECMCKICNDDCIEQYVGPCGHLLCKKCIDKIQEQINEHESNNVQRILIEYDTNNLFGNYIPLTLYTCVICEETYDKSKFSRRQRRKLNNFQCKDCIDGGA